MQRTGRLTGKSSEWKLFLLVLRTMSEHAYMYIYMRVCPGENKCCRLLWVSEPSAAPSGAGAASPPIWLHHSDWHWELVSPAGSTGDLLWKNGRGRMWKQNHSWGHANICSVFIEKKLRWLHSPQKCPCVLWVPWAGHGWKAACWRDAEAWMLSCS